MDIRFYDVDRDRDAIHRVFREVGWIQSGKHQEEAMDILVQTGRTHVADVYGEAESLVVTTAGDLRYLAESVPFSAVLSVCTSRVARKQGIAGRLTSRAVAVDALDGAAVSGLGMFEQGFYNQVGFGTGAYMHLISFDPAQLRVDATARVPRRISLEDVDLAHAGRLARARCHGSVSLDSPRTSLLEMKWDGNGFGLGYTDGPNGNLTHHIWFAGEGPHGPYRVKWLAYQTPEQFKELMALIRTLGDQVRKVVMLEPPGIQFQDLLVQPFRWRQITDRSTYESTTRASAFWQMRINDLRRCLEATRLRGPAVHFNLRLSDPIERYLDDDLGWRGVAGDYVVTLGEASGATVGRDESLPTLTASVGAFTRLWLGVLPSSSLAITDSLAGPTGLLEELDWALRLPRPDPDWDL
jgi:hypothetical protein